MNLKTENYKTNLDDLSSMCLPNIYNLPSLVLLDKFSNKCISYDSRSINVNNYFNDNNYIGISLEQKLQKWIGDYNVSHNLHKFIFINFKVEKFKIA